MKALSGGAGGGPPPAPAPGAEPAPGAGPMMSPQNPAGKQAGAAVQVLMAMKVLEQAVGAFGSTDDKGKAIIKALGGLGKAFGKQESESEELLPAENRVIQQALSGPGAGPPPGGAPPPPQQGGGAPPPPG